MNPTELFEFYRELQAYVGWSSEDADRVRAVGARLEPCFPELVDDFYREIQQHRVTAALLSGGPPQIARLKGSLTQWLRELFAGTYDAEYVHRRWRVGHRHVEIGLEPHYTGVAFSRLRGGLMERLFQECRQDLRDGRRAALALMKLLDLDLAIIEHAYRSEHFQRQRAREKARSEAAFRNLVEAAPCMIVLLRPDHSIAYFSPFAEQLTGYTFSDVLGRDYFQLFLPETERPGVEAAIRRVLSGTPTRGYQNAILCRDGTKRWMTWNAQRLEDYDGDVSILAVGQDLTGYRQAVAKLLQAERLAAIGEAMTGLAHESRNALQRSQACLEMLSRQIQHRPEAVRLLQRMQKAQDELQQLYEDVREYAAPLRIEPQRCDLVGLVQQTWEQLEPRRAGRNTILKQNCRAESACCMADPFLLRRALRNILENSLAACDNPVEITVNYATVRHEGSAALQIAVLDNGPGLNAEQRRRIFDPFFTTKTHGTGLGMAICQRIVQAHGGEISVGPGPGAEIVITLPFSPREET